MAGKLKANLSALVQEGVIDFWVDEDIAKGLKCRPQIEKALADCRGCVLLVSPDCLQSAFITDVELPALLTEAAKTKTKNICWLQVRKCDPNDDKAKALVKIAGEIRTAMMN